jgi:Serine/threonine protein phosphatase
MHVSAHTDIGQEKQVNEDAVLTVQYDEVSLLVVADGMGGHAAGDVASEEATTELEARVLTALTDGRTDYEAILEEAIESADERVREHAEADASRSGMGTTVVAAIVDDEQVVIGNVGDSRAYGVDDALTQITIDHSFVQELISEGEITPDEATTHPQRHVLTQALGTEGEIDPDFFSPAVENYLLLCSDGLTEEVSEETIREIIDSASGIEAVTNELVQRANENGGSDNISVILANV